MLQHGFMSSELVLARKMLNRIDEWEMILFSNISLQLMYNSINYYYNNDMVKNFEIKSSQIDYVVKIAATIDSPKVMII